MSENIDAMTKRHDAEIKALQGNCKHAKAEWMPCMWAPGHYGPDANVCKMCGIILDGAFSRE